MATQLRDYRIRPGDLARFVDEWRAHLAPLRRAHGFEIPAAWTVSGEDRFIWLLAHPGGWDAFEEADAAYFASPGRAALDPDPARLIDEQRNTRLVEVEPT
jgi:NIPSNAP